MSCKRLYPPPYQIAEMLYYSIGQDPYVEISHPQFIQEGCYEIIIRVDYQGQAECLRAIVPEVYTYGNQQIVTKVCWCDEEICFPCVSKKNQSQVAQLFCSALQNNYLFKGVILNEQNFIPIKSCITVCIVNRKMPNGEWANENFAQVLKRQFGTLLCTEVYYKSYCYEELTYCNFYCKGKY